MTETPTTLEIELAIMRDFKWRQNLIVPNITNMMGLLPFETDMLVLTKSGYAYGFEIKVSKSDLKADFKKPQHTKFQTITNGKSGFERYYGKFKHFYYVVPEFLKDYALQIIPDFCGLLVVVKYTEPYIYCRIKTEKAPAKLFNYKWSDKQRYEVARLGTMRIYSLKAFITSLLKNKTFENLLSISSKNYGEDGVGLSSEQITDLI